MKRFTTALLTAALLAVSITPAIARKSEHRSPREVAAFKKSNPCPSTGNSNGGCSGYQVDHRVPLAAGGRDKPDNMQWLTTQQHKEKTSQERRDCVYKCKP